MTDVNEDKKVVSARKRDNYLNKIRQFITDDKVCEVETEYGTTAIGYIKEVGRDYLTITQVLERTITVMEDVEPDEGDKSNQEKKVPVEHIEVIEMETVLKLVDIAAVSQITKKAVK